MKKINQLCQGCIVYTNTVDEREITCTATKFNFPENLCPCSNCIIKVVCQESCSKLRKYLSDNNSYIIYNPH
jgi:hypothetical protein